MDGDAAAVGRGQSHVSGQQAQGPLPTASLGGSHPQGTTGQPTACAHVLPMCCPPSESAMGW